MTDDLITLQLPGSPEHLRLVRLVTADAGSRAGFDYEEIDDMKLAVTEVCSLLMTQDGPVVTLEFSTEPSGLSVTGRMAGRAVEPTELSRRIVTALVDDYDLRLDDDESSFLIRKATGVTQA